MRGATSAGVIEKAPPSPGESRSAKIDGLSSDGQQR